MVISSPTVLRRWLAFELARLRNAAGLSQQQAADRLGRVQSHISNLERGPGAKNRRNIPALAEVEMLLDLYGRKDLIAQFRQLLEQSKRKHWWEGLTKDVIPPLFDFYLGLEEGAVSLECYDALTVTGLLQCRAYAQVLLRCHGSALPDEEVARQVDLRLRRQDVLDRPEDPLRLWAILDESVLHRMIGGPEVMAAQLDHLLKLTERPEIQLQVLPAVLPATHGVHPGLHGSFTRMTFPTPGDPGLVYLESSLGGSYHEAQAEIDEYIEIMNHLRVLALTPEHSADLIRTIRKDLP
ncbi:MAG: helix-turn-helix domain-containing protein [Pseudonocardiaceae bacterium]